MQRYRTRVLVITAPPSNIVLAKMNDSGLNINTRKSQQTTHFWKFSGSGHPRILNFKRLRMKSFSKPAL